MSPESSSTMGSSKTGSWRAQPKFSNSRKTVNMKETWKTEKLVVMACFETKMENIYLRESGNNQSPKQEPFGSMKTPTSNVSNLRTSPKTWLKFFTPMAEHIMVFPKNNIG